jgi:hypothetical protein
MAGVLCVVAACRFHKGLELWDASTECLLRAYVGHFVEEGAMPNWFANELARPLSADVFTDVPPL